MNPELFSRSESQIISTNIPTQLITQDHRNAEFLQKLKILDKTRHEVFKIIDTYENPSFVDLVRQESRLSCYLRPVSAYMKWRKNVCFQKNISWENTERKLKPWGSLGMLLAVETIKSLDFYPKLLLSDRVSPYFTRGFYELKTFRFFSWKPSLWKVSISPLPSIHSRRKRKKYWRPMGRKCFQTRLTKWTFVRI